MKRIVLFLFVFTIMIAAVSFNCFALYEDIEAIPQSIKDDLFSILDNDIISALDEMGINENSFDNIYDISFSSIGNFFKETLIDRVKSCLKSSFSLLSIVIIIGVVSTLFKDSRLGDFFSLLSVVVIALMLTSVVQGSLNAVISVIKLSGNFMLSFIPIYTLIISFSGNPAGAFTYNSFALFFAEGISALISHGFVDVMGLYFCLSISFLLNESINVNRFLSVVNKAVSVVLGLAASIFTGFLSIRSVLVASVDAVSVKSIRFLISSLIPIVGSSISEAYSSLLGSINLIKGSVAVVGIIAVLIINLPVIAETLTYYITFSFLGFACEGFGESRSADVFKCFSCGIRIILLLCVFEMFILIISTGIMLSFKGGS